jgi:hypothetical protein
MNQVYTKHGDPQEDGLAPAGYHDKALLHALYHQPRRGEGPPTTMSNYLAADTDGGPRPDLALLLQQLQSAKGIRALSPGSLLPHQQQQQELAAGLIPSDASLLNSTSNIESLMQARSSAPAGAPLPSSSYTWNPAMMMMNLAPSFGGQHFPGLERRIPHGVGYPPAQQWWNNGGQFLHSMDPNAGLGMVTASSQAIPTCSGQADGAKVECSNDRPHAIPICSGQTDGAKVESSDDRSHAIPTCSSQTHGDKVISSNDRSHAIPTCSGQGHGDKVERSNDRSHIFQPPAPQVPVALTNRPPIPISMDGDKEMLTPYQCLLREQIELFEAGALDIRYTAQGRNTPIVLGQVGVRCRHCAALPPGAERARCAVYYSQTITGIYQVVQNMSKLHFLAEQCHRMAPEVLSKMKSFRRAKQRASGGKAYWAHGIRSLGVYEKERRLRFKPVTEVESV